MLKKAKPLSTIYGILVFSCVDCFAAPPAGYYDTANNLLGEPLENALHEIIDDHTVIAYGQTDEVMRVIDLVLDDESRIELIYSEFTMLNTSLGASGEGVWNREHVWPRSFGIGKNGPDNSDLHNLFPCNASVNSSRGNKFFDVSDASSEEDSVSGENTFDGDSWEPSDFDKGRIARAVLYSAVRYDGSDSSTNDLELSEIPDPSESRMGKLSTLLRWNRNFPPNEHEKARNEALFTGVQTTAAFLKQGNRNPFIDHPQLAEAVFLQPDIWSFGKWQVEHFEINQLGQSEVSGPLADPDQDGFVNLLEFVGGAEPDALDKVPFLDIREDGLDVVIRFRKIKNLSFSGYSCEWQGSNDLSTWKALSLDSVVETDEGKTTIQILRVPRIEVKEFYRLKASSFER